MDENFISYLQQLEAMAFFSGYPVLFAVVYYISGNKNIKFPKKENVVLVLSYSYALVGVFFLGFQLKKTYVSYNIFDAIQWHSNSFLTVWAFLSLVFWVPSLRRKILLSLIHSFVFFFFLIQDILQHLFISTSDNSILRNDMNVYTDSILLNTFVYTFTFLSFYCFSAIKK